MNDQKQYGKFSPMMVVVKKNIKQARKQKGLPMLEAARKVGISRKQLEDLETRRNYGAHVDLEILAKMSLVYNFPIEELIGDFPDLPWAKAFIRPRSRKGSAT